MRFWAVSAILVAVTGAATAQVVKRPAPLVTAPATRPASTLAQQKAALEMEVATLDREIAGLRRQSSSGDLSELQAMRLQQAMERRSKAISTLSNVMKKMSDTSQSITQNIK
jgi:hypothetical protein